MDIGRIHLLKTVSGHQLDTVPGHSCHAGRHFHGQGREGLDGEHRVAIGTRSDERRGEGVDLVEVQRVVEGLGSRALAHGSTQVGAVTGFDAQDATGGGKVGAVHDVGGGTEVCANTNA